MNWLSRFRSVSAVALGLALAGQAHAVGMYQVVDLGTLSGNQSFALDINESGVITGNSRTSTTTLPLLAYRWENGVMTALPVLPGNNNFSRGYAINDAGVIVGEDNNNSTKAFKFENGVTTQIDGLQGPGSGGVAHDINNSGQIVGGSSNGSTTRPFLHENGITIDLGVPAGLPNSFGRAWAINDDGDIVGVARRADNVTSQATIWKEVNGTYAATTIGSLGDGNRFSEAFAINDDEVVVGYSNVVIGTSTRDRGFIWTELTGLVELGTLGFNHSRATDINNRGQVVGNATAFAGNASFGGAAFLYEDGDLFNLNSFLVNPAGWVLLSAEGINEQGQIIGFGTFNGQTRAFLLNPIPEPATASLALLSMLTLMRRSRR